MAIHKFTHRIESGESIPVYHRGNSQRDYTYVDDIADGLLAALDRVSGFQIFNLGNSKTVRLLDLIGLLESVLGKKARVELMPAQTGDVPVTCADINKAQSELGYAPQTTIEEGLERFVAWYRRS
jgi:UDP-glucuronate 4-epimerase